MSEVESFMEHVGSEFVIEDVSSSDVPSGTFTIYVSVADSVSSSTQEITVIIHDAPLIDASDESGSDDQSAATESDGEAAGVDSDVGEGEEGDPTDSDSGGDSDSDSSTSQEDS